MNKMPTFIVNSRPPSKFIQLQPAIGVRHTRDTFKVLRDAKQEARVGSRSGLTGVEVCI